MPAIRDYSQNYASSTTNPQVAPLPNYAQNDLLVALVSCDTYATNLQWVGGEYMTKWIQDSAGVFTDYTTAGSNETASDCYLTGATAALNHACYFGHTTPFNGLTLQIATAGAGTQTWVWEYWNGAAWTALTQIGASTISLTATAGPRSLSFNPPTDWTTTSVNASASLYYIRMRISAYTSQTTRPIYTRGWIGTFNMNYSITSGTTAGHAILWKVATASEPIGGYGFAEQASTLDTKGCALISVRDIDTKIPFCTISTSSYSESNCDSDLALNNTTTGISQSFTTTANVRRMASVKFWLKKVGNPTGNAVVKLYTHAGVLGTSSTPTGVALAVSNLYNVADLTNSYQLVEFTFPWYFQYQFLANTNYVVSLEYTGTATDYIHVGYDASTPGHVGNKATYAAAAWTAQSTHDVCFYVNEYAVTTDAAQTTARWNMPTITTNRDDSLILWQVSAATTIVPSIIEGPCTQICAKDFTGASDGWSWGYQKTAGVSSTVAFSGIGTTGLVLAASVCAINPPDTGATVFPVYNSADASVYLAPSTGVAFSGDSAPDNTITTGFGTTLNGATLAAAGTTYTLADTGVNTYHASLACNTVASVNTSWYGVRQIIASRNISNKNILIHIQPATPIAMQTTDSVGLPNACGVAVGLYSTALTYHSVYHIGGVGTQWGASRYQPAVINTGYTGSGRIGIGSIGAADGTAIIGLGFIVSSKVAATGWLFSSIWAVDTTTIAGGTSDEPVNVASLVSIAATGHERRSVISQGAGQLYIVQPIQFGDGGTNPVYVNLNDTQTEFPKQYSKADRQVSYCSIDNVVGYTYYAGTTDTIKHANALISSASKFHWRFHPSSSTSATYDFSGTKIVGAGDIVLKSGIPLSYLTFDKCDSVPASGALLNNCTFSNSTSTNALVINSVAESDSVDSCTFNNNTRAIKITAAGTYNFDGHQFSGNTYDIENSSTGAVIINNLNGANTSTYINTGGGTTTINTSVPIEIVCIDENNSPVTGAVVYIEKVSDKSQILSTTTNGSGIASTTFNYTADTPINIRIRKASSGSVKYVPIKTTGTILAIGFSLTITLYVDSIAAN